MKRPLNLRFLVALFPVSLLLGGCTTLENRRDLYFPQCVWGPYTKMRHSGNPHPKPVQGVLPTTPSSGKNVVKPQG